MRFASVSGSMAVGLLLLHRLSEVLRGSIFWYTDKSPAELAAMNHAGHLSLTIGQLATFTIAFVGMAAFVVTERRRLAANVARERDDRDSTLAVRPLVMARRLGGRRRLELFATRATISTGALIALYFLQLSYEHYLAGFGFSYSDGELMPLLAVFVAAWVVGSLIAVLSMLGLRVLNVLEQLATRLQRARGEATPLVRRYATVAVWTLRDRFGSDQLSRPPPYVLAPGTRAVHACSGTNVLRSHGGDTVLSRLGH